MKQPTRSPSSSSAEPASRGPADGGTLITPGTLSPVRPPASSAPPPPPQPPVITPERIAERAYERWAAHGFAHGRDQEDWYAAERELQEEISLRDREDGRAVA